MRGKGIIVTCQQIQHASRNYTDMIKYSLKLNLVVFYSCIIAVIAAMRFRIVKNSASTAALGLNICARCRRCHLNPVSAARFEAPLRLQNGLYCILLRFFLPSGYLSCIIPRRNHFPGRGRSPANPSRRRLPNRFRRSRFHSEPTRWPAVLLP